MARMNRVSLARKKELEQPDTILVFLMKLSNWVVENKDKLIGAAGVLALFIVLAAGVRFFLHSSAAKASDKLAEVTSAKTTTDDSQKEQYKALYDSHSGTLAGKMAGFRYADACYEEDDMDTAIALYEKLAKSCKGEPFLQSRALSSLGYAYESSGDDEKARACFEKIVALPNADLKDKALFNLARLYEKAGNQERSQELFSTLALDFPDSMYADVAKEKSAG